eukprot:14851416-Alexandrium_andersonii.AAC.1
MYPKRAKKGAAASAGDEAPNDDAADPDDVAEAADTDKNVDAIVHLFGSVAKLEGKTAGFFNENPFDDELLSCAGDDAKTAAAIAAVKDGHVAFRK